MSSYFNFANGTLQNRFDYHIDLVKLKKPLVGVDKFFIQLPHLYHYTFEYDPEIYQYEIE